MQLSPFELKDELIRLARDRTQAKSASQQFLNAGRGNPNWTATTPREAFFQLGQFALTECKRDWDEPDLGGMPQREGCARRLTRFLEAAGTSPGRTLLEASLDYGVQTLGFEPDAFVHELTDSIIGDNYPVPGRMLEHCERIVHAFVAKEMCAGKPPRGRFDLFAVEGGTAAMCYLFNSLMTNGLLKAGDTIALGTPIFTPYIEMTHLSGFKTVNIEQSEMKKGIHTWRYPESELRKLENPRVKAFFLVNPANPASVAIDPASMRRIVALVKNKRPDLLLLTDDVYGTFIPGFRSLAAELPRNTILVYSYSKHFGCTGWRLGVIGIHQDNILDAALAKMPRAKRAALEYRYSSLTPHPEAMKFIDRMVADSRNVALNHTSGVSLPQQVQMALFSLFSLLDPGDAYTLRCRGIVQERLARLLKGLGVDDSRRTRIAPLTTRCWTWRPGRDAPGAMSSWNGRRGSMCPSISSMGLPVTSARCCSMATASGDRPGRRVSRSPICRRTPTSRSASTWRPAPPTPWRAGRLHSRQKPYPANRPSHRPASRPANRLPARRRVQPRVASDDSKNPNRFNSRR